MAYIDFASAAGGAVALRTAPQYDPLPPSERGGALGALEWAVVAIARGDRLSSLGTPGRMASALGILFGSRPNPRLADPRLEALRRIAVLSWHSGYSVASHEVAAFIDAGFTHDQYETLLASISAARIAPRRA